MHAGGHAVCAAVTLVWAHDAKFCADTGPLLIWGLFNLDRAGSSLILVGVFSG